jgi:DNA-binding CsgD family transcriptional regulator
LLTPTERAVFEAYAAGKTSKEVMEQLNITENTLKFHNKHIYAKFGVSSRKQLLALHLQATER